MSDSSPLKKLPHAVRPDAGALHQSYPSEILVQREGASPDIRAFCALLARILIRCLKENDEQTLKALSLFPSTEE